MTNIEDTLTPRRGRFGKIPKAVEYSGICRSDLYVHAAARPGLFRKHGTSTLVDFDVLDQILDGLPVAEIKAPPQRQPRS